MRFITDKYIEKHLAQQGKVHPLSGRTLPFLIMVDQNARHDQPWRATAMVVQVHRQHEDNLVVDLALLLGSPNPQLYLLVEFVQVQEIQLHEGPSGQEIDPSDLSAALVLTSHIPSVKMAIDQVDASPSQE